MSDTSRMAVERSCLISRLSRPAVESGSLLKHCASLKDPRVEYLVEHRLPDITALTLCAVICGAPSWVDIAAYGHSKTVRPHDSSTEIIAVAAAIAAGRQCFVSMGR
ncbi:MAG: transposase family protein [Cyanobacteria bacterium P01_D01_bin.6]